LFLLIFKPLSNNEKSTKDISDNDHSPVMEISDHNHWVWSVAYNKSHDQLLLTGGSDCQVNLQSIVSISSIPFFQPSPVLSEFEQDDSPDNDDFKWF
jgi:hypothetical protein